MQLLEHTLAKLSKLAVAALLVYLVITPLVPLVFGSAHDLARMAQLPILLLFCLVFCLQEFSASQRVQAGHTDFWLLALLVLGLAACFHSARPMIALRELVLFFSLFVCVVKVVAAATARGLPRSFLPLAMIAASACYGVQFLLVLALAYSQHEVVSSWFLITGFDNPRFLNHTQTLTLPLLAGLSISPGLARGQRAWAWFALVSSFALLFLTWGRATGLSVLSAALLVCLIWPTEGRRIGIRLLLSALLGYLSYWFLIEALPRVMQIPVIEKIKVQVDRNGDHSRFYLWDIAMRAVAESPLLGIGPMHYAQIPNRAAAHPHNLYLQLAAEYGLPWLLLLTGGGLYFLIRQINWPSLRRRFESQPFAVAVSVACLASLIDALFSGNFVMPLSQMWIALSFGLWLGLTQRDWRPHIPDAGLSLWAVSGIRSIKGLLLLGGSAWLLLVASGEFQSAVPTLPASDPAGATLIQMMPRFWSSGKFQ